MFLKWWWYVEKFHAKEVARFLKTLITGRYLYSLDLIDFNLLRIYIVIIYAYTRQIMTLKQQRCASTNEGL